MKTIDWRSACVGILALALFSGCEFPDGNQVITWVNSIADGQIPSSAKAKPSPSPSAVPTPTDDDPIAHAADRAKANAQLLREMLQVIFMREPKDRSDFGNWADTLNQGASLEGVYNGLTHSADYRKLEVQNTGASPDALHIFGEELAYLEAELSVPTKFDATSASPLPVLGSVDPSSGGGANQTGIVDYSKKSTDPEPNSAATPDASSKPNLQLLAEEYSKQFVGASIFTLKRVACDEALKVISSKNQYREKLAFWYSKWVVRMAQRNVDFGIALRNKPDEAFHYKWALQNTDDRIIWEVLNRLHRVLNEANRHTQ